jgi:hypothetical protein
MLVVAFLSGTIFLLCAAVEVLFVPDAPMLFLKLAVFTLFENGCLTFPIVWLSSFEMTYKREN